jgi:large conductance mechanosensitive channel
MGRIGMSFSSEFREFVMRGSVVDLAIGVIIGGAFGKIVSSLVDQVLMPPIGLLTSGVDFSQLKLVLKGADPLAKKPEVAIQYGAFINTCIQFLIVAFVIFLVIQAMNRMRRPREVAPAAPPPPSREEELLAQIRDVLVSRA